MVLADQPAIRMREHGHVVAEASLPIGVTIHITQFDLQHAREATLKRVNKFVAQGAAAPSVELDSERAQVRTLPTAQGQEDGLTTALDQHGSGFTGR